MAAALQGAISTMMASSGTVTVQPQTVSDNVPGASASSTYNLVNDGTATYSTLGGGSGSFPGEWVSPANSGNAALYEARATLTSGTFTSGTAGSWLALSSTRSWNVTQGSAGTKTAVFTLEIRRVSDSVVVASVSITLTATWS